MSRKHSPDRASAPWFSCVTAVLALVLCGGTIRVQAVILWSDLGTTLAHESQAGTDVLGGAVRRDDSSADTLYFKFHVSPLSDVSTEEYFAAFQLFENDAERLALGNSLKAWAYSAFNTTASGEYNRVAGDMDLRSLRPEPAGTPGVPLPYELPRRGIENTIAFKVHYVPGEEDEVTVWLNPDLTAGASEADQQEGLISVFTADASFNQIRLRHGGGGRGWAFSDMAIATSFNDFISGGAGDSSFAGPRGEPQMTIRSWQREQGLPQNAVRALAQTADGYIWVGSDDGITRFDGVRFVTYGTREGLRNGPVRVLLADSRGALWLGTSGGGLTRMQYGRFTTWTAQDGLPSETITALSEDKQGQIWVGTESGMALIRDGKIAPFNVATEAFGTQPVTTLYRDRRGVMWAGVKGLGVFRFLEGGFVSLTEASVEGLLKDPHCLLEDRNGRLWIGAGDDFVLCREADEWRRYRIPRHLSRPYVSALAEEADGTVWAGSISEGLFEFKAGRLAALDARRGLLDNFVEALMVDREGNLWAGTGAGLSRLRRSQLTVFGQNDGLGYGPVQGLAEITSGLIWAGKPGDGLYQWRGRMFSRVTTSDPSLRNANLHSILAAQDGSSWMSSSEGILQFKTPLDEELQSEPLALPGKDVTALTEDREGRLWSGTRDGELWRRADAGWERLTNFQHAITALAHDKGDAMWIGTDGGGIFQWTGRSMVHFDKPNGLLSKLIRTLHVDRGGVLWIGAAGGGLGRFHEGRISNFGSREGLPDNTVVQILEDGGGKLWLGTRRGIAGVSKREIASIAAGDALAVYPQIFGGPEGMLSEECMSGFFPSGMSTSSGQLWFPTMKGIVVIDPRRLQNDPPPAVMLEEVVVDEITVDFDRGSHAGGISRGAPLQIAPGKKRIEFHFTGLSFAAPERVRFRYKLEGLDPGWVEAGTRRIAFYGYLPPGDYRFRVIACNSAGVWNETGATLPVKVLRRFYQSFPFIAVSGFALVGLVAGSVRIAVKRKLQRQLRQLEQERAVECERARIAQDLHDELGSSLTRLSLLSDLLKREHKTNPDQAEIHATKISDTSTETVRALEEIVWALRPGSDSVQSLVEYIAHFAKELFEGDATQCRLDLPEDLPNVPLPPEMRHNIFLIVKESLTNTLKHAHAREVLIRARGSETSLEIVVADDGAGCQIPPLPGQASRNGLGNMHRRAEAMNGTLKIESRPNAGTRVSITVDFTHKPGRIPT
jgi:signal transduction histidine kinase/ligand-binding sensor domain-containing protein